MCLPQSLRPLLHQEPDEPHKPHLRHRCQMCKELGRNCRDVSAVRSEEVADDESVFSEYSTTSDSSVASAPALQDVDGDVTPVASDEETTDELLETGLGRLKIK